MRKRTREELGVDIKTPFLDKSVEALQNGGEEALHEYMHDNILNIAGEIVSMPWFKPLAKKVSRTGKSNRRKESDDE